MTAQELYEIVKDLPREAWPNLVYANDIKSWTYVYESPWASYMDEDLAEAAFVGSMVAWLAVIKNGGEVAIKYHNEGYSVRRPIVNNAPYVEVWTMFYPTLIEALAAACKEAGK